MNNTTVASTERSTESIVIIFLFFTPLIALTIFGNTLVVLAWIFDKSVRSAQNAYYVSLALADLLIGAFVLPLVMGYVYHQEWHFGLPLCKAFLVFFFSLSPISIFHIVAIALDRYGIVTEGISHIQRRTLKSVFETCACIWILGLTLSMPILFDFDHLIDQTGLSGRHCTTKKEKMWVVHITVYYFVIPLYLILRTYWKIYAAIHKRLKSRKEIAPATTSHSYPGDTGQGHFSLESNDESNVSKEMEISCQSVLTKEVDNIDKPSISIRHERRAIKTLAIIIGAYVVCWTPWFIFIWCSMLLPEGRKPSSFVSSAVAFLGNMNSCINPIIYAFRHPEFREAFLKILRRRNNQNP